RAPALRARRGRGCRAPARRRHAILVLQRCGLPLYRARERERGAGPPGGPLLARRLAASGVAGAALRTRQRLPVRLAAVPRPTARRRSPRPLPPRRAPPRPAGPAARRGRRRAALARAHGLAVGGLGHLFAADAAPGPVRRG